MNKVAQTTAEADNIQEKFVRIPHAWIQWKGTDVCMDVHCKCGQHSHVDADFAYNVQCPACGTIYQCNPPIEFIEVIKPQTPVVKAEI